MKNRFVWIVKHIPKYVRVVEKNGHIFMYKFDEADELHNSPDNLDLIKNEIDQWVNSLR